MIAVHVCDEVDVFGFGADVEGQVGPLLRRLAAEDHRETFMRSTWKAWLRLDMEEKGILTVFRRESDPDPERDTEESDAGLRREASTIT